MAATSPAQRGGRDDGVGSAVGSRRVSRSVSLTVLPSVTPRSSLYFVSISLVSRYVEPGSFWAQADRGVCVRLRALASLTIAEVADMTN